MLWSSDPLGTQSLNLPQIASALVSSTFISIGGDLRKNGVLESTERQENYTYILDRQLKLQWCSWEEGRKASSGRKCMEELMITPFRDVVVIRQMMVWLDDYGSGVKTDLRGPRDRLCSTEGDDISFKRSDGAFNNL